MRGMTLIELLVALCLAALVLAGVATTMTFSGQAWRASQLQTRLHERAQYAFATLEPELQMAGYYGPGVMPAFDPDLPLPASAGRCGVALVTRLAQPAGIDGGDWPLPCPAQGRGAVAGSHVLTVRRASAHLAEPEAGRVQLLGSVNDASLRRILWNGELPGDLTPTSRAELRDLLVRVYYVARSADGDPATPALRVKSLSAIAGSPAFIDTEVMPGVESLTAELLPSPAAPQTARVTLVVRADAAEVRAGEPVPRLTITRRFSLRNASPG